MQAAAERIVTAIPATVNRFTAIPLVNGRKKRVAGYARVSTDEEEQLTSYEAQVDYYTRYIKSNSEWTFVAVYTDEGISAVNTKKRDGFKRMIADALDGKIDLIVTKSVSRFARNTVDTLTTVRKLKEKGIEVYFEKEGIFTLDSKGELLITIMSSLAQEESRNISENTTWGKRKQFADGVISLPYKHFLGYEKGENGLPKIVESEAKTVRLIYTLFLQGKTHNTIARYLTENGYLTPAKKTKWSISTVLNILQNEKYKGSAILQKNFTVDFLTKQVKRNEGEVPQFFVENSHPAIIEPEIFDLVQAELKKRKAAGRRQSGLHCFSSKIICGSCGGAFGPKTWHSNSKYRQTVWQCNEKYKDGGKCETPHLYEADIQRAFVEAFNKIFARREQLIADYASVLQVLTDTTELDAEYAAQLDERTVVSKLIEKSIEENAHTAQNQDEYKQRDNALADRYETINARIKKIAEERQERLAKHDAISRFISGLEQRDGVLEEFDESLWCETVETVTVYSEREVKLIFKDGSEVCVDASGK